MNYSEVTGTRFEGVEFSSIAFEDVDGDGDQDVLITGSDDSFAGIAKLYTNDGVVGYSEVTGTDFVGVTQSSIAFADVDGDGDQDVLITGSNNSDVKIARLYTNDGVADGVVNYSEVTGTDFDGVDDSSIAFADVDGDGDQDVLITGGNSSDIRIARLYRNTTISRRETDIKTFSLPDQTRVATINTTNHTVDIEVANGTDVTSLTPTIGLSSGATVSPKSGVVQNFTTPVTYTVTAVDGSTTQDWSVTVVAPLGLTEFKGVTVYPHSATDLITISGMKEAYTVRLIDVSGQVVYSGSNERSIHLSGLSEGIYFLKIITDSGATQTWKLLKK